MNLLSLFWPSGLSGCAAELKELEPDAKYWRHSDAFPKVGQQTFNYAGFVEQQTAPQPGTLAPPSPTRAKKGGSCPGESLPTALQNRVQFAVQQC